MATDYPSPGMWEHAPKCSSQRGYNPDYEECGSWLCGLKLATEVDPQKSS